MGGGAWWRKARAGCAEEKIEGDFGCFLQREGRKGRGKRNGPVEGEEVPTLGRGGQREDFGGEDQMGGRGGGGGEEGGVRDEGFVFVRGEDRETGEGEEVVEMGVGFYEDDLEVVLVRGSWRGTVGEDGMVVGLTR